MDAISTTTTTTTPAPAGAAPQAQVGPIQYADLPIDIMRAALTCASKEETRYYMRGIFIRARGDSLLDIVATDGVRMFVATADHLDAMPGWAGEGIILPADDLAVLLPTIDKLTTDSIPQRLLRVGYGVEAPHATVATWDGKAVFRVRPIDGTFPDYVRIIGTSGAAFEAGERQTLDAASYGADNMQWAAKLCGSLDGGALNVFAAPVGSGCPTVFTFAQRDRVALYVMPMTAAVIGAGTARILAPALKGTVGALRAHLTRQEAALGKAIGKAKDAIADRIADLRGRIEAVLAGTTKALPAPEKPAEPAKTAPTTKAEPAKAAPAPAAKPEATKAPAPKPANGKPAGKLRVVAGTATTKH